MPCGAGFGAPAFFVAFLILFQKEEKVEDRSHAEADSSNSRQPFNPASGGFRFRSLFPAAKRGAVIGFLAGLFSSAVALAVVWRCLPFYITYPHIPWPWYCTAPVYPVIGFLAFPVNLLTSDLAQAVALAPLSWLFYTLSGAILGAALRWLRSGSPKPF